MGEVILNDDEIKITAVVVVVVKTILPRYFLCKI